MKAKAIYKFYLKCILLALPFLLLLGIYVAKDPFMVIRQYRDYDHSRVCLSEGSVSWKKYQMLRSRQHYDSFIMGNSCTKAFLCHDWNRWIKGHPFRLFSNGDDLGDICLKLEALDKQPHQPLKNILIVTEGDAFENCTPQSGIMHIMPPDVTGKSWLSYQMTFLQGFFSPKFLIPYLKYQFTGIKTPKMNGIINPEPVSHQFYTNEYVPSLDDSIHAQGERYWRKMMNISMIKAVVPRTDSCVIHQGQIQKLQEIVAICHRHHTDLKLVIGPNLKKRRVNPKDIIELRKVLGPQNVFNYTADLSLSDYHNFYDKTHYRVGIGRLIMREIYQKQGRKS